MAKCGNGNPWPEEDIARIAGMYRAGIPIKEIARRFDTTPNAIHQLMGRKKAYRTLTRKVGKAAYGKTTRTVDQGDNVSALFGNAESEAE
jgi:transposase-like protein